jgi:hypothetical protein
LTTVNYTHIPIGIGIPTKPSHIPAQQDWVREYDLSSYSGVVHSDGVEAIVKAVMNQPDVITLICIGNAIQFQILTTRPINQHCSSSQI